MIVVADATPLHYLVVIGHADALSKLFNKIIIPSAVAAELQHLRAPDAVRTWVANPPGWLEIRSVGWSKADNLDYLGAGEREAILLAQELSADRLLIDDHDGRQEAARRHLPVIGTLRVLDEAAERGLVNLADAAQRLQQTTFYLAPELFRWLTDRDAERRRKK